MKELNYVVIIPARYGSSRLEGKPLVNLCGVPMIVRTYLQCIKACPPEKVFVACDDERIKTEVNNRACPVFSVLNRSL